jgi:hypothetical protein
MRPPFHQTVMRVLEPIADLDQADEVLDAALLGRKRPREVRMIRMSSTIVQRALDSAAAAFRSGAPASEAAIAAERTARLAGVQLPQPRPARVIVQPLILLPGRSGDGRA